MAEFETGPPTDEHAGDGFSRRQALVGAAGPMVAAVGGGATVSPASAGTRVQPAGRDARARHVGGRTS